VIFCTPKRCLPCEERENKKETNKQTKNARKKERKRGGGREREKDVVALVTGTCAAPLERAWVGERGSSYTEILLF